MGFLINVQGRKWGRGKGRGLGWYVDNCKSGDTLEEEGDVFCIYIYSSFFELDLFIIDKYGGRSPIILPKTSTPFFRPFLY